MNKFMLNKFFMNFFRFGLFAIFFLVICYILFRFIFPFMLAVFAIGALISLFYKGYSYFEQKLKGNYNSEQYTQSDNNNAEYKIYKQKNKD